MPTIQELEVQLDIEAKALEAKANARKDELQGRAQELEKDAEQPFKFDVTVKWRTKEFKLDLPQVTMRTKEMSLHLPQVTMNTKTIVFHTPSVRMVMKDFGLFKTKVPEFFMERQEIKRLRPRDC